MPTDATRAPEGAADQQEVHDEGTRAADSGSEQESAHHSEQRADDAELLNEAIDQVTKLVSSVVRLAKAQASLTAFVAREKTRLAIVRAVFLFHAWLLALVTWVLLMIATWARLYASTNSVPIASLSVAAIHFVVLIGLISYARRLKL